MCVSYSFIHPPAVDTDTDTDTHTHTHMHSLSLACALSFIHTLTVTGVYMSRTPINSDHSCRSNWMSGAKSIPPRKALCAPSRALCWRPCLAGVLASMFSGRHALKTDADGSYFIDTDGRHFRHVLN